MTKKELYTYLDNPRVDYYTMLRASVKFIRSEPYRSRLLNYILEQSKKKPGFTTTDILLWYLAFVKEDFIHTEFFKRYGNHIQILKAIWMDSNLYRDAVLVLRSGKPLQVITQVNEEGEEKLVDKAELTDGQLWNIKMQEARKRKREEREAQAKAEEARKKALEAIEQKKKKEEELLKSSKPTVKIKGVRREMTPEELDAINRLKKI